VLNVKRGTQKLTNT